LHVAHIAGKDNGLVDALSRMKVTGDHEPKQSVLERAPQMLGVKPTVDPAAHARNRKLARFVVMNGPLAAGAVMTDAFALSWRSERPYAFPPVQLVGDVLQKIQEERIAAVVVVPQWTSQPWWGLFREMQQKTIELGKADEVLLPGLAMIGSYGRKVFLAVRGEAYKPAIRFVIAAAYRAGLDGGAVQLW
jgi:hypothetical protein